MAVTEMHLIIDLLNRGVTGARMTPIIITSNNRKTLELSKIARFVT